MARRFTVEEIKVAVDLMNELQQWVDMVNAEGFGCKMGVVGYQFCHTCQMFTLHYEVFGNGPDQPATDLLCQVDNFYDEDERAEYVARLSSLSLNK